MDREAIETTLQSLIEYPEGRQTTLPGTTLFLGQPVRFVLQTEPIPRASPREPNDAELELARLILGDLPSVLLRAKAAFLSHHEQSPEFIEAVADPHIWVNEDALEYDGPTRWSFIVGCSKNASYGTHIDFDGVEVFRVWGGD
ncbi:MAG TPA: hypothetical protein DCY02_06230 [Armatimonadetes bacterium]|nr:hypothetical protein [Armatimonadota bacterium]HCM73102.1 hypothetical protein [Armatimonadota bacterium]